MLTTTIPAGAAGRMVRLMGDSLALGDLYGPGGAALYDRLTRSDAQEIREMTTHERRRSGRVLDLGCGSGRLTLPFVLRGHTVVGVDNSAPMLALLDGQRSTMPPAIAAHLTLVEADMTSVRLGRTFATVLLGATTISLLDEAGRAGLFETVRTHLEPEGRFLFSTLEFDEAVFDGKPVETTRVTVDLEDDGSGRIVTFFEHLDGRAGRRSISLLEERVQHHMTVSRTMFVTSTHLLRREELEREAVRSGLSVVARYPVGGPQEANRSTVLLECR